MKMGDKAHSKECCKTSIAIEWNPDVIEWYILVCFLVQNNCGASNIFLIFKRICSVPL
jgi:hypothetical protein